MMRRVLIVTCLAVGAVFVPGGHSEPSAITHQQGDLLVIERDTSLMFSNPLEALFDAENARPDEILQVGCEVTSCWRGYVATWRLVDNGLHLEGLADCCSDAVLSDSLLQVVTRRSIVNGRIFADWFSGTLILPKGERLLYEHMGYGSIYETEILLDIEQGQLVGRDSVSNIPTHAASFPGGGLRYNEIVSELVDWSLVSVDSASALAVIRIDSTGIPEVESVRTNYPELEPLVTDAISRAPPWTPGFHRGKFVPYRFGVRIQKP